MDETIKVSDGPIQFDIAGIIRGRLGSRARFIPRFVLGWLERLICQERLNELLLKTHPARGSEFSEILLKELDIQVNVEGVENLVAGEKYVFASNHPLGGLDGITLVKVLGDIYGDAEIKVVVNDLLMHVDPLKDVFVPVNKYGGQGRGGAIAINEAFEAGKQILIFPAGLVSRLHEAGKIADLEWKKMFIAKALEYGRRVVPIRFEGLNSMKFYKTAYWRKKLKIGVNFEQALLPSELCKAEGKKFSIYIGAPIDVVKLRENGMKPRDIISEVRKIADALGN